MPGKCYRSIVVPWLVCITVLTTGARAATVIFDDDFTSRTANTDIFGTKPTFVTNGVGSYASVLTFPYGGKIDPFTAYGKLLKFDTSVGDATQMVYLPYVYNYGTDPVHVSITAAENQTSGFNNFAVGFSQFSLADGHNIFSQHVLIQQSDVQFFLPGSNITTTQVPFTFTAGTFYTFDLGYDPTQAGIAGSQPWSLSINGSDVPIPVANNTIYDALPGFEYVGFGGRFSGGLTTRFIKDFNLKIGAVPEPATCGLLIAGAAFVLIRRSRRASV